MQSVSFCFEIVYFRNVNTSQNKYNFVYIGDLLKKATKLEDQEKRYEEPTGIGSGIAQGIFLEVV